MNRFQWNSVPAHSGEQHHSGDHSSINSGIIQFHWNEKTPESTGFHRNDQNPVGIGGALIRPPLSMEHKLAPLWLPPHWIAEHLLNLYRLEVLDGTPLKGSFSMRWLQHWEDQCMQEWGNVRCANWTGAWTTPKQHTHTLNLNTLSPTIRARCFEFRVLKVLENTQMFCIVELTLLTVSQIFVYKNHKW